MSISGPGEPYPDPATQQVLAGALEEVRETIGPDLSDIILPAGSILVGVQTELYQSRELRAAREAAPGQYPPGDRSLITLSLQGGPQVFLVAGRINPKDRFDFNNSLGGGFDHRPTNRLAYAYDGVGTIREHMEDGEVYTYTGEYGNPAALLARVRERLGTLIIVEALGHNPSA